MIDYIISGLYALASITGIQSIKDYETDFYEISNVCMQLGIEFDEEEAKYNDIYSLEGSNQYIEVILDDAFFLYDKENKNIIEHGNSDANPYKDNTNLFKIYNSSGLEFEYGAYNGYLFINTETGKDISFNNLDNEIQELKNKVDVYERLNSSMYNENSVLISDSFYFENLNNYHSENLSSTCTIVAIQILLGYFDTFYSDIIVDEVYDKLGEDSAIWCSDFSQSPGTGLSYVENIDNRFHDNLVNIAESMGEDFSNGMDVHNQINVIEQYLDSKSITYSRSSSQGNLSDILQDKNAKHIKNALNNNRPLIVNSPDHSMVAFGYDDNYVYVHTGWAFIARVPWSSFEAEIGHIATSIDITINDEHVHSNNYYTTTKNMYICPCIEHEFDTAGNYELDFTEYTSYQRIKYTSRALQYCTIYTNSNYDTHFSNIICSTSFLYENDWQGASDSDYDYDATLYLDNMNVEDYIVFVIEMDVTDKILLTIYTSI